MLGSGMQEGRTYKVHATVTLVKEPLSEAVGDTSESRTEQSIFPTVTVMEIQRGTGLIAWYRVRLRSGVVGWLGSLEIALADVLDVTEDQA